MRRFEDKVVIVTGASTNPGIGGSCARRLGSEGASLVINARSSDALATAERALRDDGVEVISIVGSINDDATSGRLVDAALERFGRVDGLVNTVGGAPHHARIADLSRDQLLDTMNLNLWPAVALVQAAVARGFRDGAVVNVSSGSPNKTTPKMASYAAAKAALNTLTRTMAADLRLAGIRVNAVSPGLTRTEATRDLWEKDGGAWAAEHSPLGRMTEADDIAAAAVFLLSADASSITGVVIDVDGGDHLMSGGWSPFARPEGS